LTCHEFGGKIKEGDKINIRRPPTNPLLRRILINKMRKTERIKNFNYVRDLPYGVPLTKEEVEKKDHSCAGKSVRLYKIFEGHYPVRYRFCQFDWLDSDLPCDIMGKFKGDPVDHHVYIEIFLNNRWITLDPSLDKGLERTMKINHWDGENDTEISSKYKRKIPAESKKSKELEEDLFDTEKTWREIKENYEFLKEINDLFQKAREIK
jgi:hypothetical protein